ncbi:hypothetical protein [Streptomyces sp. NPDC000229]|uniref:hypothetical protein n=1 Tax=Streptomyces sp. NPDC000229 TaxID=3154247 RepID=UPI003329FA4D
MNNPGCGDKDSLGVFQQRPGQVWGNAEQILRVPYAAETKARALLQEAMASVGRAGRSG